MSFHFIAGFARGVFEGPVTGTFGAMGGCVTSSFLPNLQSPELGMVLGGLGANTFIVSQTADGIFDQGLNTGRITSTVFLAAYTANHYAFQEDRRVMIVSFLVGGSVAGVAAVVSGPAAAVFLGGLTSYTLARFGKKVFTIITKVNNGRIVPN